MGTATFRVRLVGEHRRGAARSRADLELVLSGSTPGGRFEGDAVLSCSALGPPRHAKVLVRIGPLLRALYAHASKEPALELDFEDGSRLLLEQDAEAPLGLLRASSFAGRLPAGQGELRLRFDLRHDFRALLRQARPR